MTQNNTERLFLWAGVLTEPVGAQMFVAICGFSTLTLADVAQHCTDSCGVQVG